uniref:Uncharacterized protein n=1 Tax=Timema douglasi TaxID=61478 RepID=A0A7R8ZAW4_TIMDO|nr:unnamed protein product [Timema douglasi]
MECLSSGILFIRHGVSQFIHFVHSTWSVSVQVESVSARPTMAVANNSTAPQKQEEEDTKERVLAIEKLMIEQTDSRKEEYDVIS